MNKGGPSPNTNNNKLPWWTWVVPFPLFHAASQFSLLFKYDQGVSTFYVPTAIAIVLINWWGVKRTLPALFIVATLNTYYWGVADWMVWPLYAAPEVIGTFLSYYLFRIVVKGKYWIPSTRQLILFTVFGLFIPITTELLLLQTTLTYFQEHANEFFLSLFLRNWLGEFTANFGLAIPLLFAGTPMLQQKNLLLTPPDKKLRKPEHIKLRNRMEMLAVYILLMVFSITIPFGTFWFAYGILSLYIALRFGFRASIFCNLYIFVITYVLPVFYSDVPNQMLDAEGQLYSIFLGNLLLSFFVALTGRVISDLRVIENRLSQKNLELETTNKELDRFVYSTSHDLGAPLKSILGLVSISKIDPSPEASKQYLNEIEKSVTRLDSFIAEILDYSRNKRLKLVPEQIRLRELCQEILDNLKYLEGYSRVNFNLEALDGKILKQDKTRLKIILSNLISNAIKFQKNIPGHEPSIKISSHRKQDQTLIEIEDNGEGIKPEFSSKVFDMFYRASDKSKGSGLGLYIAKESVEKIGGKIDMKTEYGKGTVFTIEIPEIA